jgi:PAS domain S-box-containing protein
MHYSKKNQNSNYSVESEEKRQHNGVNYSSLFEQASEMILIHDLSGAIVDANGSLCSKLGYERAELLKMNFTDLLDPVQLKEFPSRMDEVAAGKNIFAERRCICKDGSFVEMEVNVKKMSNDLVLGVGRDVSERKKIEAELKETDLKFRTIAEKSLVGIYIIQDYELVYTNPKFAEICGYPHQELAESFPVIKLIDDQDKPMVLENIRVKMEGEVESLQFEVRARRKDGSLVYGEVFSSRGLYKGKTAIIGTVIDITERKIAAEQAIKERNLSNEIINCLPGVFFILDEHGRYLRWNKHFGKESGYEQNEIADLYVLDYFQGEQREKIRKTINKILSDPNAEADLEAEVVVRDGRRIPFYFKAKHIQYEGRPCLLGTGIDITELKRIEDNLKKSEANLHTMFDNTDTSYVLLDKHFQIVSYNQRAIDFAAKELHHTLHTTDNFVDYFSRERKPAVMDWMMKAITGEHVNYEIPYRQDQGDPYWYYVRMFPIANDKKEILGIMVAVSDITERKLTEQKLQRSVEQLTYHFNNTPLAVIEWDQDIRVIQWSTKAEEIFGWRAEEAIGKNMHEHIVHEDDTEKVSLLMAGLKMGKSVQNPQLYRYYTKDRKVLYCEWYNSILRDEQGEVKAILSLIRDVTEIRNAEEELRKSFKVISDYKIALDESSIVGITDPQGIFAYVNDNFCCISGFTKDELVGHDHQMLNTASHSVEFMEDKWQMISSGKIWRGEINNRTKSGSDFWVDMTIVPFLDEHGETVQFMSISNDITEKKKMEKEIVAQKVEEQKKITRAVIKAQEKERNKIGQELHDNVNQILASSRMYLSMALNRKAITKDLITESSRLIDAALQEIRLLSKNQISPQRKLGLKELIQILVDTLNENASLATKFEYQVASHYLDSDLKLNIYRIIQEQVNNILKHAHATHVSIVLNSDDEFINIAVTDDGRGFQPFKKKSGVGLTNMINRVESFNGDFSIDSSPGKGCKLTIRIPTCSSSNEG